MILPKKLFNFAGADDFIEISYEIKKTVNNCFNVAIIYGSLAFMLFILLIRVNIYISQLYNMLMCILHDSRIDQTIFWYGTKLHLLI